MTVHTVLTIATAIAASFFFIQLDILEEVRNIGFASWQHKVLW